MPAELHHIMIDLETMGTRPSSAIVSIGATMFDETRIYDTFYSNVSLESCLECGLTQDQATVDWWGKQSQEARSAWASADAPKLIVALTEFSKWVRRWSDKANAVPWGNGADFDLVLMKSAFNALEADPPWEYWNHRCFRTMKNLLKVDKPQRLGVHHNALDDAIHQVEHLQKILSEHNLKLK